jgi:hypothetical protein
LPGVLRPYQPLQGRRRRLSDLQGRSPQLRGQPPALAPDQLAGIEGDHPERAESQLVLPSHPVQGRAGWAFAWLQVGRVHPGSSSSATRAATSFERAPPPRPPRALPRGGSCRRSSGPRSGCVRVPSGDHTPPGTPRQILSHGPAHLFSVGGRRVPALHTHTKYPQTLPFSEIVPRPAGPRGRSIPLKLATQTSVVWEWRAGAPGNRRPHPPRKSAGPPTPAYTVGAPAPKSGLARSTVGGITQFFE